MTRSAAEIDDLLAADKSLFGNSEWVEDGTVAKLSSAVVDSQGNPIGGLTLRMQVPIEASLQRGTATLVLDGHPIQRISFRPDHSHVNKGRHPIPKELRLIALPPDRTRLHRWADNRVWPMQDNMGAGRVLDVEPPTVMDAFKLFLETCGISTHLPEPPHRPKMEF